MKQFPLSVLSWTVNLMGVMTHAVARVETVLSNSVPVQNKLCSLCEQMSWNYNAVKFLQELQTIPELNFI